MTEPKATRGFPLVAVESIDEPFRTKINTVAGLGGDPSFFQFAANAPHIVDFYWGHFYRDIFFSGILPVRTKEIARLRLAGLNGCSFCQVGDRASALSNGLSEAEVDALLHGDGEADSFSTAEQAAARAATRMSNFDPEGVLEDELLAQLQSEYRPDELMELLTCIGVLTGMARMLLATGFITRVCAIPEAPVTST